MEDNFTSPSVNNSAPPSTTVPPNPVDYSVNYQKLQPKFKDCTFDSARRSRTSSIITSNGNSMKPPLAQLSSRKQAYSSRHQPTKVSIPEK